MKFDGKVVILSVIYQEPEWQQTKQCIERCGVPVVYVDRTPTGVGSLAEAYNRGFKTLLKNFPKVKFVWCVSNVWFKPEILDELIKVMEEDETIGMLHPSFDSDHSHTKQDVEKGISSAPFVEFTAPVVRASLLKELPLDEKMPYWGHDLAYGYEVRKRGYKVMVHHGVRVEHEYIRFTVKRTLHPITRARRRMRKQMNEPTIQRLVEVYGEDWKNKLQFTLKV